MSLNSPTTEVANDLLDLHEAGLRMGVKASTVRTYINKGTLRGVKLSPRTYRVSPSDIKTFLDARATLPARANTAGSPSGKASAS